jgi:hypothetical protein
MAINFYHLWHCSVYDKRCAVITILSAQIVACANRLFEVVEMNGRQLNQPRQARAWGMPPLAAWPINRSRTKRWPSCHRFVRVYCTFDRAQSVQGNSRHPITPCTHRPLPSITSGIKQLRVCYKIHLINHATCITSHATCNTQHVSRSRSGVQHHEPINPA